MGSLGSKGTQVAQQNTRKMKVTDEDEEEEIEHEEECDCWDCTPCWEYIYDEGVQRGPFCNWQMRDWWQKRMLPKNLDIRPCDARASANRKRGDSQVAFRTLKGWFEDVSTVFATEFSGSMPRG